eukprot:gene34617-39136_t
MQLELGRRCCRLAVGTEGPPFCLHGLNAVYLEGHGWYRIDARGNKPGVDAQFAPPREQLAFPVLAPDERDLPEIWAEPLPVVVEALQRHATVAQVAAEPAAENEPAAHVEHEPALAEA